MRPGAGEEATEREWEEMNSIFRGRDTRDGEEVLAVCGFLVRVLHETQAESLQCISIFFLLKVV